MYTSWPCTLPGGGIANELALTHDTGRTVRLLIIPPFFDEANKLRRQLAEIAYRLDLSGIDSFLPDLPGWNESVEPLGEQTLTGWRAAMDQAVAEFVPTHCFSVRAGVLLAPADLPGWRYAPQTGEQALRGLLRARMVADKEAGHNPTMESLLATGLEHGLTLAGWSLGAQMIRDLQDAAPPEAESQLVIDQADINGAGLWLRAEPDEDPEQADTLAAVIAIGMLGA